MPSIHCQGFQRAVHKAMNVKREGGVTNGQPWEINRKLLERIFYFYLCKVVRPITEVQTLPGSDSCFGTMASVTRKPSQGLVSKVTCVRPWIER